MRVVILKFRSLLSVLVGPLLVGSRSFLVGSLWFGGRSEWFGGRSEWFGVAYPPLGGLLWTT